MRGIYNPENENKTGRAPSEQPAMRARKNNEFVRGCRHDKKFARILDTNINKIIPRVSDAKSLDRNIVCARKSEVERTPTL